MKEKELEDQIMEHGHVLKLTKEEYIKQSADDADKTVDEWLKIWQVIQCSDECNYMYCQGWITKPIR